MQRRALASAFSGLCLLLSGCAGPGGPPWIDDGGEAAGSVAFLARALQSGPAAREALWQAQRGREPGAEQRLRRALLQSLPGHSGYNPGAAERELRGLGSRSLPPELRALARVRLAEMEASSECRVEVQALRERVAAVVDIERELGRGKR